MEVVGLDIGFGFTKATNGKDSTIFKSVYGEATEIRFGDSTLNPPSREEHLHIEVDGKGWFVGELAERQSVKRFFTLDQKEFVSSYSKILALSALAPMVEQQDPIKLVVGLPIVHYKSHMKELSSILSGQHRVTLIGPDGKREETVVRVAQVKVVPQPMGAMLNLMLGNLGEVVNKRFAGEKIGIIDIGFKTTDFTILDRTRYSERGSNSIDGGIATAFAVIADKLKDESGISVELYRLIEPVEQGFIKIRGKKFDLTKIREGAFGKLAQSIANEANKLWADDWDLEAIVISGGGGAVVAPQLKPLLQGSVITSETGEDARLSNVRGFCKYGKHLWTRGPARPEAKPAAPAA